MRQANDIYSFQKALNNHDNLEHLECLQKTYNKNNWLHHLDYRMDYEMNLGLLVEYSKVVQSNRKMFLAIPSPYLQSLLQHLDKDPLAQNKVHIYHHSIEGPLGKANNLLYRKLKYCSYHIVLLKSPLRIFCFVLIHYF